MTWVSDPLPLDGAALRDRGMARALSGSMPWPEAAATWIRALPPGSVFTADDLVMFLGLPRGEVSAGRNNAVGAVMNAASHAGLIVRVDYVTAARPNSHARIIGLWRRT